MNESYLSLLQELNLPTNEARIYLALLQIGQTPAGEIVRRTQLHRSVVYESLDRLIEKKLASRTVRGKIAHFQALQPERLLDRLKAQEEIALDLIPKLHDLARSTSPEITVHEGEQAYRRFWIELTRSLPVGVTDCIAGSIGERWQEHMGRSRETFLRLRIERQIKWKMIVYEQDAVEMDLLRRYPELHEYRLIERKAPKDGNFNIVGDDTVLLQSATEPLVIEIRSASLARVFQNIFDILWESGKEVKA